MRFGFAVHASGAPLTVHSSATPAPACSRLTYTGSAAHFLRNCHSPLVFLRTGSGAWMQLKAKS